MLSSGLLDFRSHSKFGPLATQPLFDHSKSRLVRISGFQIHIVLSLLKNPYDLIIFIIFNFGTGLWPMSVLLVNQRKRRKSGITIFIQQALSRSQSNKANFGINYIKNGFNKLNLTLNYINFDVIYAIKVL